jgi:hypothetical protein
MFRARNIWTYFRLALAAVPGSSGSLSSTSGGSLGSGGAGGSGSGAGGLVPEGRAIMNDPLGQVLLNAISRTASASIAPKRGC